VLVAGDGLVWLVELEVGGGGVEKQQVDLKVEQVGDLVEHLLFEGVFDLDQPVHRPVARVVGGLRQAVDEDVLVDPAGRGQLRRRCQGPVGDQREQHPLGPLVQPASGEQPHHRLVDAQTTPQPVQRPGAAQRPRLEELQAIGGGGQRLVRIQNRLTEATSRCNAARLAWSSRPKL
jgi:hypothetical protein